MTKKTEENTEKLKQEIEEWKGKYLRALADYQNLEKRVGEKRQEVTRYAAQELIVKLLNVLDTLEKTEQHLKDQGLALALKSFMDVMSGEGVEKIEVLGKKFDPMTMECIEIVGSEKGDDVVEELRKGYKMKDKIIRIAQVKVGKIQIKN